MRLTILFGTASLVVFPALGWTVINTTRRHFLAEDGDELAIVAAAVQESLRNSLVAGDMHALEQRFDDILISHHDASLRLVGPGGTAIYSSPEPDLRLVPGQAEFGQVPDGIQSWQFDGNNYRVLNRRLAATEAEGDYRLIVAVPIDHQLRFLDEFSRSLWLMIAGSIALMGLMGWIAVRQGHAPLHGIVRRIRRIRTDRLDERLDPHALPGELAELALSFNEMLERVDSGVQRLSQFNADLAHELRTPIANLMTQTQVVLSRTRSADEYREMLYSNMEEYERMAHMVRDMLYLARADAQPWPKLLAEVDLAEEADRLLEYYGGWAEDRGVHLRRQGRITANADRAMIRRALGNLMSNAIKNTPQGGTVIIRLGQCGPSTASVSVENPGADIPPEHLPKLFDRFYLVDDSRQKGEAGVGLGLAIVKSIANAHRGKVSAQSHGGMTRFTLTIPRYGVVPAVNGPA